MEPFTMLTAIGVALDRADIDTDQIIPARFCSKPAAELGRYAFHDLRYDADEAPQPSFALNDARYRGARVLVARENFGCGSSREHAVWALMNAPDPARDFAFRCVIAPSFGDIFRSNACKNGLLPVALPGPVVERLVRRLTAGPEELVVDLERQIVVAPGGTEHSFAFDSFARECLLRGVDDLEITRDFEPRIAAFEARRLVDKPWLRF